ncbi:hypothetical protein ABE10_12715 [Bacillus toyonensis]|nr:hypothetical protein [Bacillus toyonensis]
MTMITLIDSAAHLEADLDWNDRTPLTDGFIEIYRSAGRSLEDRIGRVWAQVKGREKAKVGKKTYSLSRAELEGHLAHGGVLFFCVDVGANERTLPAWYAVLTPFELRRMLDEMEPNQKSASIQLRKMRRTPQEVARIVGVALRARRQDPLRHLDPNVFNEIRELQIVSVDPIDLDRPVNLDPRKTAFALEAVTRSGSSVPLNAALKIQPADYVPHTRDLRVAAGDAIFESVIAQRVDKSTVKLTLCKGLTLLVAMGDSREINVSVTFQGNFGDRKRAIEFMVGMVDTRQLRILDESIPLDQLAAELEPQIEEMRSYLAYLRDLQTLFDKFSIDTSLVDVENLDEQDRRNLRGLYEIFVEGKTTQPAGDVQGLKFIKFGDVGVVILAMSSEEPGTWTYYDPFPSDTPPPFTWIAARVDRSESRPITIYDVIDNELLPRILNLRANRAAEAYSRIANADGTSSLANKLVRQLLSHADEGVSRRDKFLDAAASLNDWLLSEYGDDPTHRLNGWQIAWRRGTLSETDLVAIRDLKYEAPRPDHEFAAEQELACALLLGDVAETKHLARRMDKEKREQMEGWPIWELYRQLVRSDGAAPTPVQRRGSVGRP